MFELTFGSVRIRQEKKSVWKRITGRREHKQRLGSNGNSIMCTGSNKQLKKKKKNRSSKWDIE